MLRPDRIGPWQFADIEVPPWDPGATLMAAIDAVSSPLIGGGVRSVTVPDVSNYESIYMPLTTLTTGAAPTCFALGCLISGVNREDDINTIYTISGNCSIYVDAQDIGGWLFPVMSKLDATPSDPDALITLTDYVNLNIESMDNVNGQNWYASVNTQLVVGDVRGSTSSLSDLPIFVGWAFQNFDGTSFQAVMRGNIGIYKYTQDLTIEDNWRV